MIITASGNVALMKTPSLDPNRVIGSKTAAML